VADSWEHLRQDKLEPRVDNPAEAEAEAVLQMVDSLLALVALVALAWLSSFATNHSHDH
jgi:hypothetical protein